MSRYLLDTNIVIALFREEESVISAIDGAEMVGLSVVVYAELLIGGLRSGRVADNISRLERFSQAVPLLDSDRETAAIYADFNVALRRKGRPIPDNDIWIAACAHQHGLVLATRDQHFSELESLTIAKW